MPFVPFPLELDEDQERRAEELYRDSIVIDLLYQGPLGARDFTPEMDEELRARWDRTRDPLEVTLQALDLPPRLAAGGRLDAFHDLWRDSGVTAGNRQIEFATLELFAATIALAQEQFDAFDWLVKATTGDDFRRAKADGKVAGFVSTQLTFGPPSSLELIEHAHRLGLRMFQLTYNHMSTIGVGCTERTDAGLSQFGAAVVQRLNELGVIVDTGHCGRRTTLDACELSEQPVVASHTSSASVFPHDRGKSDEELRALAETGGVVGVYAVPFFLSGEPRSADLTSWLDHVDHISELVGPEHVAIGTDWPMQLPGWLLAEVFGLLAADIGFRPEHRVDPVLSLGGFTHYLDFPNLARGLVSRGYTDQEIEGILGGNFLRVFEKVCG